MRINEILDITKLHSDPSQLVINPEFKAAMQLSGLAPRNFIKQIIIPYAQTILNSSNVVRLTEPKYKNLIHYLSIRFWQGAGMDSKIDKKRFYKKLKLFRQDNALKVSYQTYLMRYRIGDDIISAIVVDITDRYMGYDLEFLMDTHFAERMEGALRKLKVQKALNKRPEEFKPW